MEDKIIKDISLDNKYLINLHQHEEKKESNKNISLDKKNLIELNSYLNLFLFILILVKFFINLNLLIFIIILMKLFIYKRIGIFKNLNNKSVDSDND